MLNARARAASAHSPATAGEEGEGERVGGGDEELVDVASAATEEYGLLT